MTEKIGFDNIRLEPTESGGLLLLYAVRHGLEITHSVVHGEQGSIIAFADGSKTVEEDGTIMNLQADQSMTITDQGGTVIVPEVDSRQAVRCFEQAVSRILKGQRVI